MPRDGEVVLGQEEKKGVSRSSSATYASWIIAAAVLAVYVAATSYLILQCRDVMNVDAVAYLQIARHYAAGDFGLAINACWGPLFSWLLILPAYLGLDLALVSRIFQAIAALGFAGGTAALGYRFGGVRAAWVSGLAAAPLGLTIIPDLITPDTLMACLITWYFVASFSLLEEKPGMGPAIAAGLLGGLAYLTKHYALPFVLGHLLITMMIRLWRYGRADARDVLRKQAVALVGVLLVIIGPWLALESIYAGKFTLGETGPYARAYTYGELHSVTFPGHLLHHLRPGRLALNENRLEITRPIEGFPPVTTARGLADQLRLVKRHTLNTAIILRSADLLGLLTGLGLLMTACAFSVRLPDRVRYLWANGSVALFVAGYFPFNIEARFLWPAMGLLLAAGVAALSTVLQRLEVRYWARLFVCAILVLSFWGNAVLVINSWDSDRGPGTFSKAIREAASELPLEPPLFSNHWSMAIAMAYWRQAPILGVLTATEPEAIAEEAAPYVRPYTSGTLILRDEAQLASELAALPSFEHTGVFVNEVHGFRIDTLKYTPSKESGPGEDP